MEFHRNEIFRETIMVVRIIGTEPEMQNNALGANSGVFLRLMNSRITPE